MIQSGTHRPQLRQGRRLEDCGSHCWRVWSRVSLRIKIAAAVAVPLTALALFTASWGATAAPACTIAWDGGAGTTAWGTTANWNPDRLPDAADHVCIDTGFSVVHSSGTDSILSLQSSGTLTLSGGSLALTDTANDSNATTLTQSGGTLAGVGTLSVAGSLTWSFGTQTGAGTTRILPGASLALTSASTKTLQGGRTLRNEGTTTWENGPIVLWAAPAGLRTVIDNAGLFEVRTDFDVSETGGSATASSR